MFNSTLSVRLSITFVSTFNSTHPTAVGDWFSNEKTRRKKAAELAAKAAAAAAAAAPAAAAPAPAAAAPAL